jgi:acyl carrier protein
MTNEQIKEKIIATMSSVFNIATAEIKDNASSDTLPNWDSIGHMNLILALEEEFNLIFSDEETVEMINLKLISYIINEKCKE